MALLSIKFVIVLGIVLGYMTYGPTFPTIIPGCTGYDDNGICRSFVTEE